MGLRSQFAILFAVAFLLAPSVLAQDAPYWNPDLPLEQRVNDLVGRMTLEEKISQMKDRAPAIERLGVPAYEWWNEALHGVARAGLATVFPQAIGLGATWDEDLIFRMATVISDEARAKHHEAVRHGQRNRYQGLTIWSPNINIFRDPRWGRGQETYGEDPFLTGRLGVQFVRGLQGDDPRYFKTIATIKHYAVHSGPEPERHSFDAVVNERDLYETYLPHFERGIREAGSYSIMCAYNRVNGEGACSSERLLQDILRDEWGFNGFVVSDCGAIDDLFAHHKLVETAAEASAMAVKAGTDLECGFRYAYDSLKVAVEKGLITEAEIDTAVKRLMEARFRLGMFDPEEQVAYAQIPYDVVDSAPHRALAEEVTRKSIVLLKNEGGVLPLRKDLGRIAVIGPNADQWMVLLGNYNGTPSDPVTPLRGIREAVSPQTEVVYAQGSQLADGLAVFSVVPQDVLFTPDGAPGLRADYFASRQLDGTPLYSEVVPTVDANWADASPREDLDADDFGVRWTGELRPKLSGAYEFGVIGTTKYRLFVGDTLLIQSSYNYRDEFGDPRLRQADPIHLEAGRTYRFVVEAEESYGDAAMQVVWAPPVTAASLEAEAVAAAEQADAVVLFLGLSPNLEGEEMRVDVEGFRGGDRTRIDLPEAQERLLRRIHAVGKPTVLVLLNGSALAINWAAENVPAIVEAWYPGQAAGTAIADVLFGDYNPAGRLPVTFYRSTDDLPPFEDYAMTNRTYRYFTGDPLYAFGYGLSYTTFDYDDLRVSPASAGDSVQVTVTVTNTGDRAGEEVVQVYVSHVDAGVPVPIRSLAAFDRIHLEPGASRTVTLMVEPQAFTVVDEQGQRSYRPGTYEISAGGGQPGHAAETTEVLTTRFTLAP